MRKNKVAKNVKEFLLDLIFMTAGPFIYAVGLNGFTAPNNIAPGGVSGYRHRAELSVRHARRHRDFAY